MHIDPSPCASHIMCCAFFMKFQDNTCRNKVEVIMETQKIYLLIKHRQEKQKVCLLTIGKKWTKTGLQKLTDHLIETTLST